MTGAIVGDLAAWTWLNDHDAFYPRLISDKAKTSASSETIFTASNALLGNPEIEREKYEQLFRPKVGEERCYDTLMRAIVIGWLYEEHQLSDNVQKYSLHEEKEDWYAAHFLASGNLWEYSFGTSLSKASKEQAISLAKEAESELAAYGLTFSDGELYGKFFYHRRASWNNWTVEIFIAKVKKSYVLQFKMERQY